MPHGLPGAGRPLHRLDFSGKTLQFHAEPTPPWLDSPENILTNKITAVIDRREPKASG